MRSIARQAHNNDGEDDLDDSLFDEPRDLGMQVDIEEEQGTLNVEEMDVVEELQEAEQETPILP